MLGTLTLEGGVLRDALVRPCHFALVLDRLGVELSLTRVTHEQRDLLTLSWEHPAWHVPRAPDPSHADALPRTPENGCAHAWHGGGTEGS